MSDVRNRGAGLVTVVVILAVSGILLSGALWLAVAHYKSAVRTENTLSARAEITLCTKLVQMTLGENGKISFEALLDSNTPLCQFYGFASNVGDLGCSFDSGKGLLTIRMENGILRLSEDEQRDCLITFTFYSLDEQELASASYSFVGNEIQFVEPEAAETGAAP